MEWPGDEGLVNAMGRSFVKGAHSAMLREIPESEVPRPHRSLISLAIVAALALALAGCGRKGALDPPPGGYALEPTITTPVTGRGEPLPRRTGPAYDEEGKPIAPEGPKRRTPADWLLD
jgi:predicted small lipoprotein YifL